MDEQHSNNNMVQETDAIARTEGDTSRNDAPNDSADDDGLYLLYGVFAVWLTVLGFYQMYRYANHIEVQAAIVQERVEDRSWIGFSKKHRYIAIFSLEGREHQSEIDLAIFRSRALQAGEWPIIVNPSNPEDVQVGGKSTLWRAAVMSFMGGVLMALLGVMQIAINLKSQKRDDSSTASSR